MALVGRFMKKLRYADDVGGWGKIITITREEAIQHQRESATKMGFTSLDEEELLLDFIAVNWAYWVDDEDTEV
jgi:hypothetical protein